MAKTPGTSGSLNPFSKMTTRNKVVFSFFVLLLAVVVGTLIAMMGGENERKVTQAQGRAKVTASGSATPTSDAEKSEEYEKRNKEYQKKRQEEAREEGESVMAPIELDSKRETAAPNEPPTPEDIESNANNRRLNRQNTAVQQKRSFFEAVLKEKSKTSTKISWEEVKERDTDQGTDQATASAEGQGSAGQGQGSSDDYTATRITPGEVEFAVIDTQVTSDSPSPVRTTITSGPLKGAVLIGDFKTGKDGLIVQYNHLSWEGHTTPVNAVAIDAETARTAIYSDINHHVLSRWGSLMLASGLKGAKEVVKLEGDTIIPPGSDTIRVDRGELARDGIAMTILGEMGEQAIDLLKERINQPPTITLEQGTVVGVMFMQPLDTQWLPERR